MPSRQYAHQIRYPDRASARLAVTRAVSGGRLPRASSCKCFDCGGPAKEYDHYLGYEREYWLTVQPVCKVCHSKRGKRPRSDSPIIARSIAAETGISLETVRVAILGRRHTPSELLSSFERHGIPCRPRPCTVCGKALPLRAAKYCSDPCYLLVVNDRYHTDPEYRDRLIVRNRERREAAIRMSGRPYTPRLRRRIPLSSESAGPS